MVILASASPRRHELLRKLCKNFSVEVADTEEIQISENPTALAIENAVRKAQSVAKKHSDAVVIGADTIVVLDGEIFGKPDGKCGAIDMLKRLSGKKHEVITGLAICAGGKTFTASEITEVFFGPMTFEEICEYVDTGEPLDKSGSYALQGGATKFIEKINGDWSNVIGLPIFRLKQLAKASGIEF